MTTREATKAYRLNQWTQAIRECRSSGQTVKVWCNENNVDPKKYYYWLSQVRKAAIQALPATVTDSTIVPIQVIKTDPIPAVVGASHEVVATITVGKVIVQLSNQASSEFIINVLKAVQYVG